MPLAEFVLPQVHLHVLKFQRASIQNPPAFLLSLWRGYRLLSGLVRSRGIRVIQSHLPGSNFWGLLLGLTTAVAVFPTIHNNQEFNYGDAHQPLRQRLRRWAYRRMVATCRGLIAVSEKVKTSFGQELGLDQAALERIIAVPNGVPLAPALDAPRRAAIRARHGLREDQLVGLAAGRFCEQKNFGDLVQAARIVCGDHPDFVCFLAGDGEQRPILARSVAEMGLQDRILMPGNVFDLPDLMAGGRHVHPALVVGGATPGPAGGHGQRPAGGGQPGAWYPGPHRT